MPPLRPALLALLALPALPACSSGSSGAAPEVDAGPEIGVDTTVTAFDGAHFQFTSTSNTRVIDVDAALPDRGVYQSIVLHLTLACPSGKCDPWDRFGTVGVVTRRGAKPEEDTVVEIARFITPYGVGASWDFDVTDLRPLLKGAITLRGFIDTWVGPGSTYGNGWLLTTTFELRGGVPAKEPVAVLPIWTMHAGAYGDPSKPLSASFPPQTPTLPASATSYALRTFVTGHGQGNLENCAEFCPREHTLTVGGVPHVERVWRADCATTAAPGQQGTWKYARAGWCPGADVRAWTIDVTEDLKAGATIGYGVATYENTCRPDAATCAGCALGTGCAYDGGNHTEPSYSVSSVLIAYR